MSEMIRGGVPAITMAQLEAELRYEREKANVSKTLRNMILTLATVAAVAVLVSVFFMPVLKIYGNSMTPTFSEGNIVVSVKGSDFETGDIVAFSFNNKVKCFSKKSSLIL